MWRGRGVRCKTASPWGGMKYGIAVGLDATRCGHGTQRKETSPWGQTQHGVAAGWGTTGRCCGVGHNPPQHGCGLDTAPWGQLPPDPAALPGVGRPTQAPSFALPCAQPLPPPLGVPGGLRSWGDVPLPLTMQAACTASEMVPALGSHQKAAHWKRRPVSTMSAKVWASRPTPRKVTYRTWHSQMCAASSSSCGDPVGPSTLAIPQAALPPLPGPLCQEAGPPMGVAVWPVSARAPCPTPHLRGVHPHGRVRHTDEGGCPALPPGAPCQLLDGLVQHIHPWGAGYAIPSAPAPAVGTVQAGRCQPAPQAGSARCWGMAAQLPHSGGGSLASLSCSRAGRLTHGPGHRQAANVQRLIGLHRLPHRFQDIHCQDRRGEETPPCAPPSPRTPRTQPGRPRGSGHWASHCPRADCGQGEQPAVPGDGTLQREVLGGDGLQRGGSWQPTARYGSLSHDLRETGVQCLPSPPRPPGP